MQRRAQEQYTPSIEMVFAKLKNLLRKAKERSYDALWQALSDICDLLDAQECWNSSKTQDTLQINLPTLQTPNDQQTHDRRQL